MLVLYWMFGYLRKYNPLELTISFALYVHRLLSLFTEEVALFTIIFKTGFMSIFISHAEQLPCFVRTVQNHFSFIIAWFISLKLIAGASETVVLNMSTLVWSVVTSVQGRVPLASEVFFIAFPSCNID